MFNCEGKRITNVSAKIEEKQHESIKRMSNVYTASVTASHCDSSGAQRKRLTVLVCHTIELR